MSSAGFIAPTFQFTMPFINVHIVQFNYHSPNVLYTLLPLLFFSRDFYFC